MALALVRHEAESEAIHWGGRTIQRFAWVGSMSEPQSVTVRQMLVALCHNCRSPFLDGPEHCANCGQPWKAGNYWTDESGDMLFELVGDLRKPINVEQLESERRGK